MSEFSNANFTERLDDTKSRLDSFLNFTPKAAVQSLVNLMIKANEKKYTRSALGDYERELFNLLQNIPEYKKEHYKTTETGDVAIPLSEELEINLSNISGKKLNKKAIWESPEVNNRMIEEYQSYVDCLKTTDEIDKLFLDKINAIYKEYKSSSDYMTRLVHRRLEEYNNNIKKGEYKYDLTESTRVLILKHFIKQFNWFDKIKKINTVDLKEFVKNNYNGDYTKIDDSVFSQLTVNSDSWNGSAVTEGFVDVFAKIQGIIKHKSEYIKLNPKLCEMICNIIVDEKLTSKAKDGTATVLADCFAENYSKTDLTWFKKCNTMGMSEFFNDVLCNIVEDEFLTDKAKNGTAKTLPECFVDFESSIKNTNIYKSFDTIEMTEELCGDFCKFVEKKNRSKAVISGKAQTLEECFSVDIEKPYITSINSFIMYIYRKIYDELSENVYANCPVKSTTYNNAIKKGGDLYEKNRKKLGLKNYELLQIADDLANAKFSSQGKTREYIYIFAIAFDMTATGFVDEDGKEDPRKFTDIQKNLFFDYYSDNIVNNLSNVFGINNNADVVFSTEVDGYGINYKNPAEITFLWSINQNYSANEEFSVASQKLSVAYEIIEHCKRHGKAKKAFCNPEKEIKSNYALTELYKNDYLNSKLEGIDDIKKFLVENYPFEKNKNPMQINNENRTAFQLISKYKKDVTKKYNEITDMMFNDDIVETMERSFLISLFLKENGAMYDFYKEEYYLQENRCKHCEIAREEKVPFCKQYCDKCISDYLDYINKQDILQKSKFETRVIEHLNSKMKKPEIKFNMSFYTLSNLCDDTQKNLRNLLVIIEQKLKNNFKLITENSEPEASRFTILSLCYYDMILTNWQNKFRKNIFDIKSFEFFFNKFSAVANQYLIDAGYQKINSKNLIDICLAFLIFRDSYKQLYSYAGDELVDHYDKTKAIIDLKKGRNINREIDLQKNR